MSHLLYVPNKAFLVCSKGMTYRELMVTSQTTVRIANERLAATVNDRMNDNFNCAFMVTAGAFLGVIVAAIFVAAVILSGGTLGVVAVGAALAGGAAAGGVTGFLAGMVPCICGILTQGWLPFHPLVRFEKQYPILETSQIPCFIGGQVIILYSEKAAQATQNLQRANTIMDFGMIAISAFAFGVTGMLTGACTGILAVKGAFVSFGAAAGWTSVATITGTIVGSEILTKGMDVAKNEIYEVTGIDKVVSPYETDVLVIKTENAPQYKSDDEPNIGDKGEDIAISTRYGGEHVGNESKNVSEYQIEQTSDYARLVVKEGSIEEVGKTTTTDNVKGTVNKTEIPKTNTEYYSNTRESSYHGIYEDGKMVTTTVGTQYAPSLKGTLTDIGKGIKPTKASMLLYFLDNILNAIKNPLIKGYIEDYVNALTNDEMEARKSVTVYERKI